MQWSSEELALKSLQDWWIDAGVAPDHPVSLKANPAAQPSTRAPLPTEKAAPTAPKAPRRLRTDQALEAQKLVAGVTSTAELKDVISGFKGCDLRQSARSTVVYDGNPQAKIMIICGTPDTDEEKAGLPAAGAPGLLLDKMFASIGLNRETSLYIASLMPWRVPGDRVPDELEWSICKPFLMRQIELVAPKIIITIGKVASQTLLSKRDNIAKLRGETFSYTHEGLGTNIPLIPLLAPSYLLNRSAEKAKTWADLQIIEKLAQDLGLTQKP
ncbi:uracil-DNA glycosylase [Hirschia litorea]|uniref:Type-4 uracil-DNA glycosylase n=1 Tax=Hirschia litorea TaxID=1199156 RepID=A0ABW2IIU5_9PROT